MPPKKKRKTSTTCQAKRKSWISNVKSQSSDYLAATGTRYTSDQQLQRYGATAKSLAKPSRAFLQPVNLDELEQRQASVPAAQLALAREQFSQALLVAVKDSDIRAMSAIMHQALEIPVSLKPAVMFQAEIALIHFCAVRAIPLEGYPFRKESVDYYLNTIRP